MRASARVIARFWFMRFITPTVWTIGDRVVEVVYGGATLARGLPRLGRDGYWFVDLENVLLR